MRKIALDGKVYQYISRICVDRSTQQHDTDYSDTNSYAVMWSTVRNLFVLSKILGWSLRKLDHVQAFLQAKWNDDEEIFIQTPRGFHVDSAKHRSEYILKIKKNVYRLKHANYGWSKTLKTGLFKLGFKRNKVDPCLYLKYDIICAIYDDDTFFWSINDSILDRPINELKELNFNLTDKGNADSFLVLTDDDETIAMSQPASTAIIIKSLGLQSHSK